MALAAAELWFGHELLDLVGFPEGEGALDHEDLIEDFNEAADAVAAEVSAEAIIREALLFVTRGSRINKRMFHSQQPHHSCSNLFALSYRLGVVDQAP